MRRIFFVFYLIQTVLMISVNYEVSSAENVWVPLKNMEINMGDGISFVDKNTGWAAGARYGEGLIYHTIDGGETWEKQRSGTKEDLLDIYFSDKEHGWAVGLNGTILATSTGGAQWTKQTSGLDPDNFGGVPLSIGLSSVHFVNDREGWIAASNAILHTANGGISWERQYFGTRFNLLRIYFVDSQNGWAVGYNGVILRTTTGGKKRWRVLSGWQEQESGVGEHLFDVFFIDKHYGWAVSANLILHTENGGKTWTVQSERLAKSLRRIRFIDRNRGWAIGAGKILFTINGGKDWQSSDLGHNYCLTGISFVGKDTGWIIGEHGTILRYRPY